MLKAVLFDLDDTLIDWSGSDGGWEARDRKMMRAVFDYVTSEGCAIDDFDALNREFRNQLFDAWETGRGQLHAPHLGRVIVQSLVAVGVAADQLDERACLQAFGWGAAPGVVTFPDVPAVLRLLLKHDIRIGIVTNAHQPMWVRDPELEQFDLLQFFPDCRFSAADVGYLKPHPRIFEAALACVEARPDEAVFVGDNPVADIAGAQSAGMQAVLRTRQAASMLSGLIVPDHTLQSLAELPAVLDGWFAGWRS